MCLLICAEMYQVSRLQHICELFIITQLQSMPSRELASMNLDIVDLLKKAKVIGPCISGWLILKIIIIITKIILLQTFCLLVSQELHYP